MATFEPGHLGGTVFGAFLKRVKATPQHEAIVDGDGNRLTHDRLLMAALVLGRIFARETRPGEAVGVLLPNAAAALSTFFALNAFGRVPAMLNFTAGPLNIAAAVETAEVRRVITSRRFIDAAGLEGVISRLEGLVEIVYLEDVRKTIGTTAKITALVDKARLRITGAKGDPLGRAVILFTSGTEGKPKGVVLSHANILANCAQVQSVYRVQPDDIIFNPLPVFHSFGLTVGALLPLVSGAKTVLYPSPLHYKAIPPLIAEHKATILIATDTFLTGYGRAAKPDDLASLRMVAAGAERVKQTTRDLMARLEVPRVVEGYGATEAAPVIAANPPDNMKPGSVGKFVPWIEHRLEPVPGLDTGGRLFVRGPNVMTGYMFADAPGVVTPPEGGWHDTGDIVSIDDEGFITIQGRAKRFAKIGGEMVSLTAVEAYASSVWPEVNHAVVALPDARKGEQLVLISDGDNLDRADFVAWAKDHGAPEIMLPRKIIEVESLPVLGTGKTDYPSIEALAAEGSLKAAAE
ncbi:MAG: AMP-binding protein [Pseudomonadota bacterium]